MDIRDKVRHRRRDRIRQLAGPQPAVKTGAAAGPRSRLDEPPGDELPIVLQSDGEGGMARYRDGDGRWTDPEYVWKQRESERWKDWAAPPSKGQIRVKLGICAVLFVLIWAVFQLEHPAALQAQAWIGSALTQEFGFEQVSGWYEKHVGGSPSFIPVLQWKRGADTRNVDALPLRKFDSPLSVPGQVAAPYNETSNGILLRTPRQAEIRAIDTGRVIFAGDTVHTGWTVVIQHTGGWQSVYGLVEQGYASKNDWVAKGAVVALASDSSMPGAGQFFFAIRKDSAYLDPLDVIRLD